MINYPMRQNFKIFLVPCLFEENVISQYLMLTINGEEIFFFKICFYDLREGIFQFTYFSQTFQVDLVLIEDFRQHIKHLCK